jgi:signal transduction histidine kinase/DNA-binding response OmpR family regulator/HPt (histidine-containing phosphotransfer) domain-containing protein
MSDAGASTAEFDFQRLTGPNIDGKVKLTQLNILYNQLPQGLVATALNAGLLVYILSSSVRSPTPQIWLGVMLLLCTLRFGLLTAYRSFGEASGDYPTWRTYFALGAIATACAWGTAGVILFPSNNYQHQAFIGFVLAGMAAGASGSMAANDKIFRVFLVLTVAPYMCRLIFEGGSLNYAMAGMCAAFIAALSVSSLRNARATRDALRLRFINGELTNDLEKSLQRQQETNLALQEEIKKHQATMQSLETAVHDAEASVRVKSQFLANMSHEIRTPMNGVFGMTDLLMRTELDARQKKLVGTINESAKSLLTIINDILDLSRIEAGKFELDKHEFNVRELLERSVELIAGQAHFKGLEISLYISPDVPAFVMGDSGRIKQIVLNLLGNALKFTKYGEIRVRVSRKHATGTASDIEIQITDTGIGIDRAMLDKLFQPFTQAETTISRRFGGTGLGLAITRHLCEMMEGTVALDSDLGKGTVATVSLRLAHSAMTFAMPETDPNVLSGARILVIDDRETNREIIASYLEGCAAQVDQAASTAAAWPKLVSALAIKKPYHAAVVDMVMPEENGLEFARRIKAHPELARLKIVLATSLNWQGDAKSIRDAGIEAILTKPIRRGDLVDAAARAVTGTRHAGWRPNKNASLKSADIVDPMPIRKSIRASVLLAEDNPVNVEVAKEYLTSFGCSVSTVSNGLEATAAMASMTFDIVLMDCQMPIMDGLTATRRIRALEAEKDAKPTPIIALTANAFAEDRARCIDAGMNDYLSKPYSEDQLYKIVEGWTRPRTDRKPLAETNVKPAVLKPQQSPAPAPTPPTSDLLDQTVIAPLRSKRPQLLAKIITTFLEHAPVALADLNDAATTGDCERMGRQAHSLKSSSANLGAVILADTCRTLESIAPTNDVEAARALVRKVTVGFDAVRAALEGELASLPKQDGKPAMQATSAVG